MKNNSHRKEPPLAIDINQRIINECIPRDPYNCGEALAVAEIPGVTGAYVTKSGELTFTKDDRRYNYPKTKESTSFAQTLDDGGRKSLTPQRMIFPIGTSRKIVHRTEDQRTLNRDNKRKRRLMRLRGEIPPAVTRER